MQNPISDKYHCTPADVATTVTRSRATPNAYRSTRPHPRWPHCWASVTVSHCGCRSTAVVIVGSWTCHRRTLVDSQPDIRPLHR